MMLITPEMVSTTRARLAVRKQDCQTLLVHTAENDYYCDDISCPCQASVHDLLDRWMREITDYNADNKFCSEFADGMLNGYITYYDRSEDRWVPAKPLTCKSLYDFFVETMADERHAKELLVGWLFGWIGAWAEDNGQYFWHGGTHEDREGERTW